MLLSQSNIDLPSWSSGSRRRPLTAETRVRFPMGVPNVKTHLNDVFFSFQIILRESNGRISTQSCELCARPGEIAQTCQKDVRQTIKKCACVVRATLYWSSGAIPYGGTKQTQHIQAMCFVCFKTKDRRKIQTYRTIRVLQA